VLVFDLPIQFAVGAGASNFVFGQNVEIVSTFTKNASPGPAFEVDYVTVPPKEGPTLRLSQTNSPRNTITLISNNVDWLSNEEQGHSNMSFGIRTAAGFVGMTWPPDAGTTQTFTVAPVLMFYFTVGNFLSNTLANWQGVRNRWTAIITVPYDFRDFACTLTYNSDGTWDQRPGRPS
jgi:hypothetical protein